MYYQRRQVLDPSSHLMVACPQRVDEGHLAEVVQVENVVHAFHLLRLDFLQAGRAHPHHLVRWQPQQRLGLELRRIRVRFRVRFSRVRSSVGVGSIGAPSGARAHLLVLMLDQRRRDEQIQVLPILILLLREIVRDLRDRRIRSTDVGK